MIESDPTFTSARRHLRRAVEAVKPRHFEELALAVFRFQATYNPIYRDYLNLLGVVPTKVRSLRQIPFLPIGFFKNQDVQTGSWIPEQTFTSSGTTGQVPSRHLIRDVGFYERNAVRGFAQVYGPPGHYTVLALLPAYLERQGSSLVHMAQHFMAQSVDPRSGFFLHDYAALHQILRSCGAENRPTLLLGVSFALWDMAEQYPYGFPELLVMETGGMKGRRPEITREELHDILGSAFRQKKIHSEYGMTELLSQAYAPGDGVFQPAPTMRVMPRDITDPFAYVAPGRIGALNIIDLANLDTISFIATDDLGRQCADGHFEVLGRLDTADVRGCNLMTLDQ